MLYTENKYIPAAYLLKLYSSMLKDDEGKQISLTDNQVSFISHLFSFTVDSKEQALECMDIINAISNQQKEQQKQDHTL